ncbi:MAG: Response regulator containing a CheY-like receiver domain and an DNA-binding domain [Pseudonocardiales bacterium]|nr:Response regulator containing a CheY-like receiver domain and an DNA-binding domain [Pseudonocardiales bacterium]
MSINNPLGADHFAYALDASPYPALVLEVPSELIVAANQSAARLLDPTGGPVLGFSLEEFTTDRATVGPDLFAGGRLNGFEAFRVLRRAGGANQRVRIWVRTFADQPSSRYVLVLLVVDQTGRPGPHSTQPQDSPAVVGTADASLIIERISSDADSLFGWPVADLLGRPLVGLVAEPDVSNCLAAINEASVSQNGVNLYLEVRGNTEARGNSGEMSVAGPMGCEVLILPLQPTPSCAFVFLPTSVELSRAHVSADLSAILLRLGRGAEVAQLVRGATAGLSERDMPGLSHLTTRELEILTRLLDGDRAPAIAAELFLTQGTVRNHLASIFGKVGVTSQQQLLNLFRAARASRA